MENKNYTTIRIWTDTHEHLRKLSGFQGEKMVNIIDRLVSAELAKEEAKLKKKFAS